MLLRNAAASYLKGLFIARGDVMHVTVISDQQVHSCFASCTLIFVLS
jgi:hypothetical protein